MNVLFKLFVLQHLHFIFDKRFLFTSCSFMCPSPGGWAYATECCILANKIISLLLIDSLYNSWYTRVLALSGNSIFWKPNWNETRALFYWDFSFFTRRQSLKFLRMIPRLLHSKSKTLPGTPLQKYRTDKVFKVSLWLNFLLSQATCSLADHRLTAFPFSSLKHAENSCNCSYYLLFNIILTHII